MGLKYRRHTIMVAPLAIVIAGCVTSSTAPSEDSPSAPHATSVDLQFCVDDLNSYRARNKLPALARAADLEEFAAAGARQDHQANTAHQHITENRTIVVGGENELLNQGLSGLGGTVQKAMHRMNELSFAEGVSGGHYQNMMSSRFTQMGCGVYRSGEPTTITMDFR